MQTRFARFQNVPEMLTLHREVADACTTDDLGLPTPDLAGGEAETVVVDPLNALTDYVADLASRAGRIRNSSVDPSEDNILKVTGDGRRAALDLRLVGEAPDLKGGKLASAAERKHSHMHHVLDRFEHTHLDQWLAHFHLVVRTEVPVANAHTLAGLPESAAEAHHHFLAKMHHGVQPN